MIQVRLIQGHVMEVLSGMASESVQMVCTSPPYWGLRDYGVAGQIGLEPTIEEYVEKMVMIFREVRRVLRPDGVLFLNLGSSYFGGGGAHKEHHANPGLSKSFDRGGVPASCGKNPSRSRPVQHEPSCDTDGKGQPNSQGSGLASCHSDGECPSDSLTRHVHTPHNGQGLPLDDSHPLSKDHDNGLPGCAEEPPGVLPPSVPGSTKPGFWLQLQDGCLHSDNPFSCPSFSGSCFPSIQESSHKRVAHGTHQRFSVATRGQHPCTSGNGETADSSGHHIGDKVSGSFSLPKPPLVQVYQNIRFKAKDLIMVPEMVAMALQNDGWYLRSSITWCKKAPMPESVTDRPTNATEKIFMLTKSPRYFYDAEAVREPSTTNDNRKPYCPGSVDSRGNGHDRQGGSQRTAGGDPATRNLWNYWILGPEPFKGWLPDFKNADYVDERGIPRKLSPNCPLHGPSVKPQIKIDGQTRCDEQRGSDCFYTDGIGVDLSQDNPFLPVPTVNCSDDLGLLPVEIRRRIPENNIFGLQSCQPENSSHKLGIPPIQAPLSKKDLLLPAYSDSAISHNNQMNKTVRGPSCSEYGKDAEKKIGHIGRIEFDATVQGNNTPSNNILDLNLDYVLPEPLFDIEHKQSHKSCRTSNGNKYICSCVISQVSHFATFPPELVRRCIAAGTSERGCCPFCKSPWKRVVEKVDSGRRQKMADGWDTGPGGHGTVHRDGREKGQAEIPVMQSTTLGWTPTCTCPPAEPVPCVCLDPFGGAMTTSLVAAKMGRDSISIELNPQYITMGFKRIKGELGMLVDMEVK